MMGDWQMKAVGSLSGRTLCEEAPDGGKRGPVVYLHTASVTGSIVRQAEEIRQICHCHCHHSGKSEDICEALGFFVCGGDLCQNCIKSLQRSCCDCVRLCACVFCRQTLSSNM